MPATALMGFAADRHGWLLPSEAEDDAKDLAFPRLAAELGISRSTLWRKLYTLRLE